MSGKIVDLNQVHRPAFVTGSRVYGEPRDYSDLDLVVVGSDEAIYDELLSTLLMSWMVEVTLGQRISVI